MFYNSTTSFLQQIVSLVCGLIVPQLILSTFGSSANGTVSSIGQFISITALIQGGITSAARVAFYEPIATGNEKKTSVVYKTCAKFFANFAFALVGYILILAFVFPIFVETTFGFWECFLLVLILGINSIFEYLYGMSNQLLLFADQKAFINTIAQMICTILNAIVSVCLIHVGCTLLVVKFISALIFILRPVFLHIYVKKKYNIDKTAKTDNSTLSQSKAALSKSIAFYAHTSTDTMVITACMNVMWVSVYSVHKYVVGSISTLVASVLGNTEALFGQMYARNEKEAIEREVPIYDLFSKILSTIFFATCIILISQFVGIYTRDVEDISYYHPLFAILLCISEMVYCMSLTYNNMVMAAGHIRQTQWISIMEAVLNIVISLVLVKEWGIVGVAIGTILAFLFNTVANIIYMRKHIFKMSLWFIVKSYLVNIGAGIVSVVLFWTIFNMEITSFLTFFAYAVFVFGGVTLITFFLNLLLFNETIKFLINKLKGRLQKNK